MVKADVSDDNSYSDDEHIDPKQHEILIRNILNLNKIQRLNKPTRTEPSSQVSEFNLCNSSNDVIQPNELTKSFKKNANLKDINKKLRRYDIKNKTLAKPLEKPQAERIRRTVGYESTRLELDKWDAVVAAHRAAEHLRFPLNTDFKLNKNEKPDSLFRLKTELEKEIEEIKPKVEIINIEEEEKVPLTMKEMLEKRREAAKLRAHMSFKEAKARRQNKIKSKKYHRIQRREKIKKQLQEFELLQKTDPEAALLKLEEIEKARAEERISLRHKGTGKWARNKQIRAKYDNESRKVLAQQLTISKELTQKVKLNDSSDSEGEDIAVFDTAETKNNPWVNGQKNESDIDQFLSGYRKFWEQEQKNQANKIENKDTIEEDVDEEEINVKVDKPKSIQHTEKIVEEKSLEGTLEKKTKRKNSSPINKPKEKVRVYSTSCIWNVTDVNQEDVDNVFDECENKLVEKLRSKYAKLKKSIKKEEKRRKKIKTKASKPKTFDLSLNKVAKRPVIDKELTMNDEEEEDNNEKNVTNLMDIIRKTNGDVNNETMNNGKEAERKEVKIVQLNTKLPDLLITDDNEDDLTQRETIAGAFEDEDIVDEFNREKDDDIEKNKPKDIDLTLPGWGSWFGKNMPSTKKKRKRFIIRMPKKVKRRDENKGNVIIFEGGNKDVKNHLVTDLPFPFKSVKDFEASIRQPIGNTFVPETAFKKLTLPAIKTKLGTIIEPLNEDILLKKKYMA